MNHRWIAAIHEAGHVVVCEALGYQVGVIEARDDGTGRTHHVRPDSPYEEAIVAMAGPIAEQFLTGDTDESASRSDYAKVVEISARCPDLAERCQFIVDVEQLARNRVHAYWDDIVATARDMAGGA